ncbi:MAG: hypothetical protein K5762_07395 [Bacilli bacterium]|nr:hypothetical protein [Bacilli bacterium]
MTEEEYQQVMEERRSLLAQLDGLTDQYNNLVERHNEYVQELNYALEATAVVVKNVGALRNVVLPVLGALETEVEESFVNADTVYSAIVDLETKYFLIKNVATAQKNLTDLDDQYHRKYRFYETLRKVTLGYIIGVDNNIISNEKLRVSVEKNQLLNSEYWLAYALSGVMLWINDEKEACDRAINKALELDPVKTNIFYLLVNLRFGRKDAARSWYRIYMNEIDVYDLGEEFQYVLEAYLHHAFGQDKEFEQEVGNHFNQLLKEIRASTSSFDDRVKNNVITFANTYPHLTNKTYDAIQENTQHYEEILQIMTRAEVEKEIALYYRMVLEGNDEEIAKLSVKIENVLHNLVSAYDDDEYQLIKEMKRNEYIVKARGDLDKAKQTYLNMLEQNKKKLTLGELIFRFAFADIKDKVDTKLRMFAVGFMLDPIKEGYKEYHREIVNDADKKFEYTIDGCKLELNADSTEEGRKELNNYYDKNKRRFRLKDGKYKTFMILSILFLALTAGITSIIIAAVEPPIGIGWWIALIAIAVMFVLFTLLWVFRGLKIAKKIQKRREEALIRFKGLMESIQLWRKDLEDELKNHDVLNETLDAFNRKGE